MLFTAWAHWKSQCSTDVDQRLDKGLIENCWAVKEVKVLPGGAQASPRLLHMLLLEPELVWHGAQGLTDVLLVIEEDFFFLCREITGYK